MRQNNALSVPSDADVDGCPVRGGPVVDAGLVPAGGGLVPDGGSFVPSGGGPVEDACLVPDGGGPEVEVREPGPVVLLLPVVPGGGGGPEVEACRVLGPGPGGSAGFPCACILAELRILAAIAIASLSDDGGGRPVVVGWVGSLDCLVHVHLYLFT